MKTQQPLFSGPARGAGNVTCRQCAALLLLLGTAIASASVRYVDASSASPTPPYTTWTTAAHTIQDAVDAAALFDEIVVTNGVYATGGRAVGTNLLVNRVAVDKPLTVRSVNGPQVTVIQGHQVPGTTNGDGAIRCAYLASGTTLSGFTLTRGATRSAYDYPCSDSGGGGVWCESTNAVVINCVLVGNSASRSGGGALGGTLNTCTLAGNSADSGGGAYDCTLNCCTLTGNSAGGYGGGAGGFAGGGCTLNHCTLAGNSAELGGGAAGSILNHCTLSGNFAERGGGAAGGTLNNCILTANSAEYGGGMSYTCWGSATLNNCLLTGNSAAFGGGAHACTLYHCTLTGNSATNEGGGTYGTTLINCIVYFNTAPTRANHSSSIVNHSCTTPLPIPKPWQEPFLGNISLDPQLLDAVHLSADSPCRGAGSIASTTGTDIDGEAWATPPSIGCDEYYPGAATGPLGVTVVAAFTNIAVGYPVRMTALIEGRASLSVWDFGDGMALTNRPYSTHGWTTPGEYGVVLRAYNESNPGGVSATVTVHVVAQPVHYVVADNATPVPPYTSWATAAASIQDAVDAAMLPGAMVLVSDGIYATGGRSAGNDVSPNRVLVDKPLTVRSVNGPEFTVVEGAMGSNAPTGGGAMRCVYLANGASFTGFTLIHGAATSGGGVWCESADSMVSHCIIVFNCAELDSGGTYGGTLDHCILEGNSAGVGGGASGGTLNHCTLTGNSAGIGGGASYGTLNQCMLDGNGASKGGGAAYSMLNSCTLTANSASDQQWLDDGCGGGAVESTLNNCALAYNWAQYDGGGAASSTLRNCIVYSNEAEAEANYASDTVLNYCCTAPLPTNGVGNITNAPLFVDDATAYLRLQSNSPCINAGLNAYAPGPTDHDGNPRIVSGTVDIGAYEFQGAGSVISYAWLQHYGLPTDGSADATDADADGHNTWQEWHCQTDPTNALSVLRLLSASHDGMNVIVTWQSIAGVNYFLECSTNLTTTPRFTPMATNLPGQPGTTTYTDTNAAGTRPCFYRVGIRD